MRVLRQAHVEVGLVSADTPQTTVKLAGDGSDLVEVSLVAVASEEFIAQLQPGGAVVLTDHVGLDELDAAIATLRQARRLVRRRW